jgi:hypothetical protein
MKKPIPATPKQSPKAGVVTLVILVGFTVMVLMGRSFVREWYYLPDYDVSCDGDRYEECMMSARIFIEKDYAEAKDLSMAFLTLLTAFLVGSITFSEKIVDVHRTNWAPKAAMITCWCLILVAIVACGSGLALMVLASSFASYLPGYDYRYFEHNAVTLFVTSGLSFGASLGALLCAGIISLTGHKS